MPRKGSTGAEIKRAKISASTIELCPSEKPVGRRRKIAVLPRSLASSRVLLLRPILHQPLGSRVSFGMVPAPSARSLLAGRGKHATTMVPTSSLLCPSPSCSRQNIPRQDTKKLHLPLGCSSHKDCHSAGMSHARTRIAARLTFGLHVQETTSAYFGTEVGRVERTWMS